jgi:XRE family transcriptional regulator, aerobic/anaerobic benzoate catabolism transcriptional regulator
MVTCSIVRIVDSGDRHPALSALGRAVRARRTERELTLHALSQRAGVSERFLIQLEGGRGNISVARLCDVARALDTSAAELLKDADELPAGRRVVALLGLRGAGKSSIGNALAERLGVSFVELDQLLEHAAGMSLGEVFELGGESFYRRLERDVLRRFLDGHGSAVLATGGSLVNDAETFELLRRGATTIWLKARPEDHMTRVLAQGDERPVKNRRDAMAELRALLGARAPLYAQADHAVDTSLLGEAGSVDALVEWLGARSST